MVTKPYISTVIVGRNDNYGVDFLGRISTFVRSLDYQCAAYPDLMEIVIVEWNPPEDRPRLAELLPSPKNLPVRVITVDPSVHAKFGTSVPLLEWPAKNTGARRASGEFLLITNPDILFSEPMIDFFANRSLDPDCFYRTDRYDFHSDGIQNIDCKQYVDFACEHTFQAHCLGKTISVTGTRTWWDFPRSSPQSDSLHRARLDNIQFSLHTNASGDFMLLHRDALDKMGGLYNSIDYRWHNDSYSMIRMHFAGLQQQLLTVPLCIFHQHHERKGADVPWDPMLGLAAQVPGAADWGLADQTLTEIKL